MTLTIEERKAFDTVITTYNKEQMISEIARIAKSLQQGEYNDKLERMLIVAFKNKSTCIFDIGEELKNLAKYPLTKNSKGKYSAKLSDEKLPVYEHNMVITMAHTRQRSKMIPNGNKEYISNVPLWMRAHKEYNNVMYEEWSKEEADMPWLNLGVHFWEGYLVVQKNLRELMETRGDIHDYIVKHSNNITSGSVKPTFTATRKALGIKNIPVYSPIMAQIIAGVGFAYSGIDNKFRILDLANFDKCPDWGDIKKMEKVDINGIVDGSIINNGITILRA